MVQLETTVGDLVFGLVVTLIFPWILIGIAFLVIRSKLSFKNEHQVVSKGLAKVSASTARWDLVVDNLVRCAAMLASSMARVSTAAKRLGLGDVAISGGDSDSTDS